MLLYLLYLKCKDHLSDGSMGQQKLASYCVLLNILIVHKEEISGAHAQLLEVVVVP